MNAAYHHGVRYGKSSLFGREYGSQMASESIGQSHDRVRIAMPRQPFFGAGAMAGEIDQLGVLARTVEHLDRTDPRAFDHDEGQVAVDREGAVDTKHHAPPPPP